MTYVGPAARLSDVWMAVRAALRSVLDVVTIADLASGSLPESVEAMAPCALNTWISRCTSSISLPASHDPDANLSPAVWSADDFKSAGDRHGVLTHHLKPEVARAGFPEIEATAIVGYLQRYICRTNLEHQVRVCRTRVFGNVVQRFPTNPDQGRLRGLGEIGFIGDR